MLSKEELIIELNKNKNYRYNVLYSKYKEEKIKNILLSKIQPIRVYGRKCIIKEIDSREAKEFHNNYHLDNSINSKVNIGLYYNNEPLSVLSLSKSRYNKNYEYEMIRYTIKERYAILGGFMKLLHYFERTYLPQSIITYKKLDLGTSNIYEKNGFTKLKRTSLNYFWIKENEGIRLNRENFQKYKLKNNSFKDKENNNIEIKNNETEVDYMYRNNYYRVFDSGNDVFVKSYKLK